MGHQVKSTFIMLGIPKEIRQFLKIHPGRNTPHITI